MQPALPQLGQQLPAAGLAMLQEAAIALLQTSACTKKTNVTLQIRSPEHSPKMHPADDFFAC